MISPFRPPFARQPPKQRRFTCGFSLIEVVLALGIISIAFVPLMGLLPTGMASFRSSMDRSATVRIAERLGNEARQSDFDSVSTNLTDRYFDEQGNEVTASTLAIYQARTKVETENSHLKRLVIQVARNPAGSVTIPTDAGTGFWKDGVLPVMTQSILLARSSSE